MLALGLIVVDYEPGLRRVVLRRRSQQRRQLMTDGLVEQLNEDQLKKPH